MTAASSTFQTFSEIETLNTQQDKVPFSITTTTTKTSPESYSSPATTISTTLDETIPRAYQPLAMDSPLNTEQFAIWPPTPRNPDRPGSSGADHYGYTSAEDVHSTTCTSSWDRSLSLESHHSDISTTEGEMTRSYSASMNEDPNEWCRPRTDYTALLTSDTPELASSYGSYASSYTSTSSIFPAYGAAGFASNTPVFSLSLDTNVPRRISDANSLSSIEGHGSSANSEYGRYDEYSSGYDSALVSYKPIDTSSWSTSGTPLSPHISPATRFSWSSSRARGSPSPSRSHRVSPYDKAQRWSTGNYNTTGNSSSTSLSTLDPALRKSANSSYTSSPVCSTTTLTVGTCPPGACPPGSCGTSYPGGLLPSQIPLSQQPQQSSLYPLYNPDPIVSYTYPYLPSHHHDFGLTHTTAYTPEYSEKPDLFSAALAEQIPPPPEDMNPSDPDMKPHEQDLRFEGDLYTPRWVRGHGNKREGWCGICKPGRWLVLKNSAFWYDKSFTHGISAQTGTQFQAPKKMRRMDGNPDVWEGWCHSCEEWVAMVNSKKKGTTWFRHAYKCHVHSKVKEGKRRRGSDPKQVEPLAITARNELVKVDTMAQNEYEEFLKNDPDYNSPPPYSHGRC